MHGFRRRNFGRFFLLCGGFGFICLFTTLLEEKGILVGLSLALNIFEEVRRHLKWVDWFVPNLKVLFAIPVMGKEPLLSFVNGLCVLLFGSFFEGSHC